MKPDVGEEVEERAGCGSKWCVSKSRRQLGGGRAVCVAPGMLGPHVSP